MGEVYRARDVRLDRLVALKVLAPSILHRPEARARFEREARTIASLDHPHICALYDIGRDEGVDFLVMQYLEGETLATRLGRGRLPVDDALRYAVQTAAAIDAAHRQGVTHRDLKPANIMLTKAGAVLLDFGVAKLRPPAVSPRDAAAAPTTSADITRDGAIVGTARYMAPEVLEGADADARSDLFSFGAVVYEMVTGRRAFEGDSHARVIASVLDDHPPPIAVQRPDAPQALDAAVRTCLAKNPADRWQHAGDLLRHLEWIADGRAATPTPAPVPAARAPWRRRAAWALAAVGGVAAATAGVTWRGRPPAAAVAGPPPHVVALPCTAPPDRADSRAYCDGLTDSLIGRLMRLTATHPLQVTPHIGGLRRDVTTPANARKLLGATRVLQASVVLAPEVSQADGEALQVDYRLIDAATEGIIDQHRFGIDAAEPFAAYDSLVAWLARNTDVDLTHPEREALLTHGSANPGAYASYLTGRGYLAGPGHAATSDLAHDALARAVELDPQFAEARASLGVAAWTRYEGTGDLRWRDQARTDCEAATRIRPRLSDAHRCLGTWLHAAGHHDQAAAAFEQAIAADATNDDAHFGVGREHEDLRDFSMAEQVYRRAVEQRPRYFATYTWLGNFYRRQARYEDAALAFERAVALVPSNARGRAFLAVPWMYLGRYEEAAAQLRRSIEIEPTREAYVNWGMTLFRMRRFDEAATMIERGLALGAPDHRVLASLARAHYWSGRPGRREQARQLYADAIQLAERDLRETSSVLRTAELQVALAEYYAKAGQPGAARALLSQAGLRPDSRPTDPHQLLTAALVYHHIGDRAEALKWLERAVYWGVPAAELRAWIDFDGLRGDPAFQRLQQPN